MEKDIEPYFLKKGNKLKFIKSHPHLAGQKIEMGVWELIDEFGEEGLKDLRDKYLVRGKDVY